MSEESENIAEDNLGKRHQTLNIKVNDTAAKNVDFDQIRYTPEYSDIDKLYKIDLAAKYQHTDYILEVLKSCDSFFITRVINKCSWLFDEQHIHIINPKYLHQNILKFMSFKMRKKFLTAVSKHVRTEKRAEEFYEYCMENKLTNIAFKFFLFTSEDFKRSLLFNQDHPHFKDLMEKNVKYIRKGVGNSFTLLEAYLNTIHVENRYYFAHEARYMYSVNNDKYLDLLEKYGKEEDDDFVWKLNLMLSKRIMLKHKERVLVNPRFYVKRIDKDTLIKHITADDAKVLAVASLPSSSSDFWDKFYYSKHKFLLKFIPHEELYAFLKKIYNDKYPYEEFELSPWFHTQDFHLLMTTEERENWALRHLKLENPIDTIGDSYFWYEFINFETSFEAIKQMIATTNDPYSQQGMASALMRSARNNRELETVFTYYDEKIQSNRQSMDCFLYHVIGDKNIFEFDEDCWAAFYKLLFRIELYNTTDLARHNNIYRVATLLYYILHEKDINEDLNEFLMNHFSHWMINTTDFGHYNKLTDEKRNIVYNYLFTYYIDRLADCKEQLFTIKLTSRLKKYFDNISGLMRIFRKEEEKKEPKNNGQHYKKIREINNSISDRELLRRLKKDTNLVVSEDLISKIRIRFEKYPIKIPNYLKKLKAYFPDVVTSTYLDVFLDIAKSHYIKSAGAGVYAIFQLADEKTKMDFLDEHAPIQFNQEHIKLTHIQKAVCRLAWYSRPFVSMTSIEKYINKDTIKYYKHNLPAYLANLPIIPLCLQLAEIVHRKTQYPINYPWFSIEEFEENNLGNKPNL